MQTLFDLLKTRYTSAAQCAAALGISRQAYAQARARCRLSDRAALRAAALLGLDPGQCLLINATANDAPAPKREPAPHLPEQQPAPAAPPIDNDQTLYYVNPSDQQKCERQESKKSADVHCMHSKERNDQIDLCRWVLHVARIPADSPRFAYYVSRWAVPDKITRAKAAGTFESTVAGCPTIPPEWLSHVPAAMAEYRAFNTPPTPVEKPAKLAMQRR